MSRKFCLSAAADIHILPGRPQDEWQVLEDVPPAMPERPWKSGSKGRVFRGIII